ncbi:hypothetical protein N7471_010574 [Penicillium samsonianum]|uniref:uncharacterized protein n=1 Tax=Penicillium samsonianum TaxID=1882272 RepID=UPI002548B09E|nr:uncharacterized protein N7471_010574 [Penicillium samsonianum]KAJ6126081.1 hypothetical protein N7471_010574 [Penicillium samsonianum]
MSNDQLPARSSHTQDQPTNPTGYIDKAIRLDYLAVRATVDGHPDLPALLDNLGNQLYDRWLQTKNANFLNAAIECYRVMAQNTAHDHPDYPARLDSLAELLDCRYGSTGLLPDLDDLDSAIALTRTAILATHNDNHSIAERWNDLGRRLETLFFSTRGKIADLDEGIQFSFQAVTATPEDSFHLAGRLVDLARKFKIRHEFASAGTDELDRAISLYRSALKATCDKPQFRAECLRDLGIALEIRYGDIGEPSNLQEAIALARDAINAMKAVDPNHPSLGDCFHELATKLGLLYEEKKSIDDLDEAIALSLKAIKAGALYGEVFVNLRKILALRYTRTYQINDSQEAAKRAGEAV